MDLLYNAYSTAADEDEENEKHAPPPLKRAKPDFPHTGRRLPAVTLNQSQNITTEVPIAGRYKSEPERAIMASAPQTSKVDPPTSSACSPVQGSISDSFIRKDIYSSLKNRTEGYTNSGRISDRVSTTLMSHTKAVNAIEWSKNHLCSSSSCICWYGFFHLCMERVELRTEESTRIQLSYRSSKRHQVV